MCFTNVFYIRRQRDVLSSFYIYIKLFCRVQNRRPKYKQVCIGRYIMGLCCRYVHVSLTSTRRYELTTRQRWQQRSPGKSGLVPRKVYCTAMRIYDILLTAIRLIVRTWICLNPAHITKPCKIRPQTYCYYYYCRRTHFFILCHRQLAQHITKMFFVISISNKPRRRGQTVRSIRTKENRVNHVTSYEHNRRLLNITDTLNEMFKLHEIKCSPTF